MIVTKEMRKEIREHRRTVMTIEGKPMPGSVPFLIKMLATANDPHDRDELLGELAGEYLRAELEDEHLLVQRERVANNPDAAVMWLGLAHSLSLRKDGAEEARTAAARAVEISYRVGTLIRYSLTCQAELARQINDPDLFEKSLRELTVDASNHRAEDSSLDARILDDLPKDFCPSELVEEYRNLLGKSA